MGNLRYADPQDEICKEAPKVQQRKSCSQEGYTIQSANEVLDDIIQDLKSLQNEINIEHLFNQQTFNVMSINQHIEECATESGVDLDEYNAIKSSKYNV